MVNGYNICAICDFLFPDDSECDTERCDWCSRHFCETCCKGEMKQVCKRCKCECIHEADDDECSHNKDECKCDCLGSVDFHSHKYHPKHENMQQYRQCNRPLSCFQCKCDCTDTDIDTVHSDCKCNCKGQISAHANKCECSCKCADCDCRCNCKSHQSESDGDRACSFCRLKRVDNDDLLEYVLDRMDTSREYVEKQCLAMLKKKKQKKRKFGHEDGDSESGTDSENDNNEVNSSNITMSGVTQQDSTSNKKLRIEEKEE